MKIEAQSNRKTKYQKRDFSIQFERIRNIVNFLIDVFINVSISWTCFQEECIHQSLHSHLFKTSTEA